MNDNPQIKGLFAHDSNDDWKEEVITALSDCDYACLNWDALPHQFGKEILESLRAIIINGNTFDFYYLMKNEACYKATIVDFSTREEYPDKVNEWREKKPAYFKEKFDDYESGSNGVQILFLASKFEKLESVIPLSLFKLYKNMGYNIRKGIAAYTDILTPNQIMMDTTINNYKELLRHNYNLILTGAPGTGKTYLAKQIAAKMILDKEYNSDVEKDPFFKEHCCFVQFHPSYDYTDFVEGLRPINNEDGNIGFERKDGVFKEFCKKALKNFQDSKKSEEELNTEEKFKEAYDKLRE